MNTLQKNFSYWFTRDSRFVSLVLVLSFGVVFYLLRSSLVGPVWDDAPRVAEYLYDNLYGGIASWSGLGFFDILVRSFSEGFSAVTGGGYRPLSQSIATFSIVAFGAGIVSLGYWAFFVGLLHGCYALSHYYLAQRFIHNKFLSAVSALIVLCSAPYLASSWVLMAGLQVLVLLSINLILLAYLWYRESRSIYALIVLLGLMVIGPMFREFIAIAIILVLLFEVLSKNRRYRLIGLSLVTLLLAIYPTLLPSFVFGISELPFKSIFEIGLLGGRAGAALSSSSDLGLIAYVLNKVNTSVPLHTLILVPSFFYLASLLALVAIGFALWKEPFSVIKNRVNLRSDSVVLILWWLGAVFPFLFIYVQEVHLLYSVVPMSILALLPIARLSEQGNLARLRKANYAVIALGILALLLNPFASYRATKSLYDANVEVASNLKRMIPQGSVVVGNFLNLLSMELFSGGHFKSRYSLSAGIPTGKFLSGEAIDAHLGQQPIYFLESDFDYQPSKVAYHSHQFIGSKRWALSYLGEMGRADVSYVNLDPVRWVLPYPLMEVLFSPDLENDYYRGSSTFYSRDIQVSYRLFQPVSSHFGIKICFVPKTKGLDRKSFVFDGVNIRGSFDETHNNALGYRFIASQPLYIDGIRIRSGDDAFDRMPSGFSLRSDESVDMVSADFNLSKGSVSGEFTAIFTPQLSGREFDLALLKGDMQQILRVYDLFIRVNGEWMSGFERCRG